MISLISNQEGNRKALHIDTSDEKVRVNLIVGDSVVKSVAWSAGPGVGKEVLEKVSEVIAEANVRLSELERIAVNNGPGRKSSALRSGVIVASFLALAGGAKLVIVSGCAEKELVHKVFSASFAELIIPRYDRLGFDDSRKKA